MTDAMGKELFDLLFKLLEQHGTTSAAVNDRLKTIAADPTLPIPESLIGIIDKLCNCTLLIAIVNCLCKKWQ